MAQVTPDVLRARLREIALADVSDELRKIAVPVSICARPTTDWCPARPEIESRATESD